jgi:hypothetical protein
LRKKNEPLFFPNVDNAQEELGHVPRHRIGRRRAHAVIRECAASRPRSSISLCAKIHAQNRTYIAVFIRAAAAGGTPGPA